MVCVAIFTMYVCSGLDYECECDRGCLQPRRIVGGVSATPADWQSRVTFDLATPPSGQAPAQVRVASYPGVQEERERLVHTVCACV